MRGEVAVIVWLALVVGVGAVVAGEAGRVEERYLAILRDQPGHVEARRGLWEAAEAAGRGDELLAQLRGAAGDSLNDGLVYGAVLVAAGRVDEAREVLAAVAGRYPTEAAPWLAVAELPGADSAAVAAALGEALAKLGEAGARERGPIFERLAEARQAAGDGAGARRAWDEALALAPDDAGLRERVAERMVAAGDGPGAEAQLGWLAEKGSPEQRVAAWQELSELREATGDLAGAVALSEDALDRLGPDHWMRPELEQRVATLHGRNGTLDEHLADLTAEAERRPDDWRVHLRTAAVARTLGRMELRIAALNRAHRAVPGEEAIARELAEAEADFGDLDRAAQLVEELAAARPGDVDLVFVRADLALRRGRVDEARALVEGVVADRPGDERLQDRARQFFEDYRLVAAVRPMWERAAAAGSTDAAIKLAQLAIGEGERDNAVAALLAVDSSGMTPEVYGQFAAAAAEVLKPTGAHAETAEIFKRALAGSPDDAGMIQGLAAALAADGQDVVARDVLEQAAERIPEEAPALDRQLFELTPEGTAQEEFVEVLAARARERRGETDYLRLARWQRWAGLSDAAEETLRGGLTANPDSAEVLGALADLAVGEQDAVSAVEYLGLLARLQPERQREIASRIASLQLDQGARDGATEALVRSVEENPESVDALMDLAAARQRADDWYGALETWAEAFRLATASQRQTMIGPILAVTQRLGLPDRGLEFLVDHARGQRDEPARIRAWRDAVAYAVEYERLDGLAAAVEGAAGERPDDFGLVVARAAVASAQGDDAGALVLLERGGDLAADAPGARQLVLDAAVRAGDVGAVQRAAAAILREDAGSGAWRAAVGALEQVGAADAAADVWTGLRRRHGRDPEILEAAAAYFNRVDRSEDQAAAVFAAADLPPPDGERLMAAARLAAFRGDREGALKYYRRVLNVLPVGEDRVEPLPGFDELLGVRPDRAASVAMRALGGFVDPESLAALRDGPGSAPAMAVDGGVGALRLEAVRGAARLASGGTARDEWLKWCAASPSPFEAAWGYYDAGEFAAAHDVLLKWLPEVEEPGQLERAIIWNAMRRGSFDALREWIDSDPELRRRRTELLFLVVSQLLEGGASGLPSEAVATLFPATAPVGERWSAAWLFAGHADLTAAVRLGRGVVPDVSAAAQPGIVAQVASWELSRGRRAEAEELLTLAGPASSPRMDDPALSALRMRWLISDAAGRAELREAASEWVDGESAGEFRARQALLAALAGDAELVDVEARRLVDAWRQESGSSEVAAALDDLVRSAVVTAQAWRLFSLAEAVAREAVEGNAEVVVAAQSGDPRLWRNEIVALLAASQLMRAAPREVDFVVRDLPASRFDYQAWAGLARRLETEGFAAAALAVREECLRRRPGDTAAQMELLAQSGALLESGRRISLLEALVASEAMGANFNARRDQTEQLVGLLLAEGEPGRAVGPVDALLQVSPADPRLLQLKDRVLAAAGRTEDRRALWEERAALTPAAAELGLARVDLDTGEFAAARDRVGRLLTERPAESPDAVAMLLEIAVAGGDARAAVAELNRLAAGGQWSTVAGRAAAVAQLGAGGAVADLLQRGARAAGSPEARFLCAEEYLKLAGADVGLDAERSAVGRMRASAELVPELVPRLYQVAAARAEKSPGFAAWFQEQMEAEWRDGGGSRLAGEQLLQMGIRAGDRAGVNRVLAPFLEPQHYSEPAWRALGDLLAEADFAAEAAAVYRQLMDRRADRPEFVFLAATALWRAGERSAAIGLVEPWLELGDYDRVILRLAAGFFREIDRPRRAAELYARLVADDVAVTEPDAWAALARLRWELGDFDAAERFLRVAFQNPAHRRWQDILEFWRVRGDLAARDPGGNAFRLRSDDWRALRVGTARELVAGGHFDQALAWLSPEMLPDEDAAAVLAEIQLGPDMNGKVVSFWETALAQRPPSAALREQFADMVARRDRGR